MAGVRDRPEWRSDDPAGRRRELYARAAGVFRRHGYRGTTVKALARACGLSIPGLYRYFPSKRAFALFPLQALYPELQARPPDLAGDPVGLLRVWVDAAAADMPNYVLALRLAREAGLTEDEQRRVEANLTAHAAAVGGLARRAAQDLDERAATELAWAMINVACGPALTGVEPQPDGLRRQLRALLRGYGLNA